jgi:antitoxin HicB
MEVVSMEKLFYPAVFHKAEEGGFWVSFPDIPECLTEGDDMTQAYKMAVDALGLAITDRIENKEYIPKATEIDKIELEDGTLVIVGFDLLEYRKKHNSRAVKKTLSIPEWLNEAAMKENINFSQVLQEALMEKVSM